MTLVTRPAMSDDSGVFTDGTAVTKAFIDLIYEQIDDQAHSTTNPTIKPKTITDEVIAARGSKASLDARLDVALGEDGTLNLSFANVASGLRVGFAGSTSAGRIDLGDVNNYWDVAAGGAGIPGFFFDATDSLQYNRSTDTLTFVLGGVAKLSIAPTTTSAIATTSIQIGGSGHSIQISTSGIQFIISGVEAGRVSTLSIWNGFKGANVASAAAIVPTGNIFHVTGTVAITSITSTNIQAGTVITIIFDDVLTFTDGSNLILAGNFVTTANDTITLAYDGSNWYEIARSIN